MQHYCRVAYSSCLLSLSFTYSFVIAAHAQIIPDSSLEGNNSIVVPNQIVNDKSTDIIMGGSSRGNLLFHSFQDFNIKDNQAAYFSNPEGITDILGRVTGTNASNIFGKLGILGNANLFVINPNGIVFGPNAILDLGGSFLASTANSIKLADGYEFSATEPQSIPLLTINVPIRLGFLGNQNPGSIEVQGVGHTLSTFPGTNFIVGAGNSSTGLRVQNEKNIALIGGDVIFNGGIATAPAGKIEVASIDSGQVGVDFLSKDWIFDYSNIQKFKNIQIANLSLLDASGFSDGEISVQGNQLVISDASYILIQSQNSTISGRININALDLLSITGTSSNPNTNIFFQSIRNRGGIVSQSAFGRGSDINISAKKVFFQSAGEIASDSSFTGIGGDIVINALDSIQLIGASQIDPLNNFSVIASSSNNLSNSGNITLSTNRLLVQAGASIVSDTFGSGTSGNININASQSILVEGSRNFDSSAQFLNLAANGSAPSAVASSSYGFGNAGNLFIYTPQLTVLDGASISTSTAAYGNAGNIFITAPDFVRVSGFVEAKGVGEQTIFPSLITSSGLLLDPVVQQLAGLPPIPTGNAGSVFITTNDISIENNAELTVRNDGLGNAGTLNIDANSIRLNNLAKITASTQSGNGGDINTSSQNLSLRNNSAISAEAKDIGNGGNIVINTNTLVGLENSNITAQAFEGNGGNIQINTQGLFLSPDSVINASSNFGIDGVVNIQTLGFDVQNTLVPLQTNFVTPEQIVAGSCLARRNASQSSFVVTGSGNLPVNPYSETQEWESLIEPPKITNGNRTEKLPNLADENNIDSTWKIGDPIVEAQGIVRLPNGRVLLGSKSQKPTSAEAITCKG